MSRRAAVFLMLVAALAGAAAVVLALGSGPPRAEAARPFHELVGGLGFGPAVEPSRCEFSFDPRLCPACPNDVGPIPGGMIFCPHHAGSLFDPPPVPDN